MIISPECDQRACQVICLNRLLQGDKLSASRRILAWRYDLAIACCIFPDQYPGYSPILARRPLALTCLNILKKKNRASNR
jgi:hypothetical protein